MEDDKRLASTSDSGKLQRSIVWVRQAVNRMWPFALTLVISFLSIFLFNRFNPAPSPLTESEVDALVVEAMASATPRPAYSADVYQAILPSLVLISTEGENDEDQDGFGIGTGVVVNDAGDILTALHVVVAATTINLTFADGTEATAVISAAEPENDIAILTPSRPPELLVPAILGSSSGLRIGDEAYAVGNPLGLAASMSAGVISGFNRSLPVDEDGLRLEGLIQFDTAVNPGNSGGPLLNRQGQVIGIVTALANPTEQNFFIGIGFAVPIGTATSAGDGGPQY